MTFDITIYEKYGGEEWAQTRFLVHGYDDILWTNDKEEAIKFLAYSIGRAIGQGEP